MKAPSARSSRASAPFSTTKRAPEIFAAVAKSISPSASPISKCCLRLVKLELRRRADLAHLLVVLLVLAERHVVERQVGNDGERIAQLAVQLALGFLALGELSFSAATSAISALALASSFAALAAPISFDAALRRACASCSLVTWPRRASSSAISSADNGASPRFLSPASNAAGLSLIHLMSNTSISG